MNFKKWWSLPFCRAALCILAMSSNPACAQLLKYQVMGVVYAPPGSASNVTYGKSTSVGSTNTFTNTNTNDNVLTTSISLGAGLFGTGADLTLGFTNEYTYSSQTSNSVQIQATQGNSISTMGPISSSLGVDHDNDIIYIWLNPVVSASLSGSTLDWTGISSNSCDPNFGPSSAYQGVDGCDPNQYPYPDVVGIPVWCLKNPYYPSAGCSQWLPYTSRSWDQTNWGTDPNTGLPLGPGLTMRDYADILQADPFVVLNGSEVNVCHPTYGTILDPNLPETINPPLSPSAVASLDAKISASEEAAIGGIGFVDYASYTPSAYKSGATSTAIPAGDANACSSNLNATSGMSSATLYGTSNVYRFSPSGTVEYPVPGPNGLPSTYTGTFQSSTQETDGSVTTDTHAVGTSVTFGASWSPKVLGSCFIACGSFSAGDSNTYTVQHQSSTSNTASKTYTAAYTVVGPQLSDNYIGPATFNVYLDKIYGTFAFYSDIEPLVTPATLGNIGININGTLVNGVVTGGTNCNVTSTTPCLSMSVPAGKSSSGLYPIILTNDSPNPMTMVGPAITFSDPGFQLDETDGTDTCSNTQLQPGQTCTANFSFVPAPSDAPIAIYATSATVNADIIAAGTVNIASTSQVAAEQNILVTNYGLVRGTVTGSSQGGVLVPVETPAIVLSASNPPPYLFTFTSSSSTVSQQFQFTNNYPLTATIGKITYSDPTDFTTTTDGCSGTQVPAGGICNFTVTYNPVQNLTSYLTSISVVGTVPGWYGGETFQLASAGAAGNSGVTFTWVGGDNDENSYDFEFAEYLGDCGENDN